MVEQLPVATVVNHAAPGLPEELLVLAAEWVQDASQVIIDAVWAGYDRLIHDPVERCFFQNMTGELERRITSRLEVAIGRSLTGYEPFDVQHGTPEWQTRKKGRGRPKEPDIAFVHRGDPRVVWPIEAKVMPPDRPISKYVESVDERYLSCDYAPFCGEGGMVGYALRKDASELLDDVAKSLKCELDVPEQWRERHHRTSTHSRSVPEGKLFTGTVKLHHLMMDFRSFVD